MHPDAVLRRIQSFPRWHYEFELLGHKTPIFDPGHVNRHAQRRRYFFDPLVALCGGSLAGRRVLDLGCNAGYWSLLAAEAGADYVLGIDGRPMHTEQAELVFEAKGIDRSRYDFRCADLFEDLDRDDLGRFDLVLCLGLFYHINQHARLIDQIARVNDDLLVIDTAISGHHGSYLELKTEPIDEPRNALKSELIMHATRQAVIDIVAAYGYESVVLRPNFTDAHGFEDYRHGLRRAFVCSKKTPLDRLDAEPGSDRTSLGRLPAGQLVRALADKARRRVGFGPAGA